MLQLIKARIDEKEFGIHLFKRGEGEFKEWYDDGNLFIHCFYKDNVCDGEYKKWLHNGKLCVHHLYENGIVKKIIKNIKNLGQKRKAQ